VSTRFVPLERPLVGTVRVPGDKSISHRVVLFAAMAQGTSRLKDVLDSADVRCTINAVSALGATVHFAGKSVAGLDLEVTGWGEAGPKPPARRIDCGNSGTTCRLLLGVLAGWPVAATLDGDASLRRRPMRRVTDPLVAMGAHITTTDGRLPLTITGGGLHGIRFESPVASAQLKTAVLLAGVRAQGNTVTTEPALSRDHSEMLLPAFGVPVSCDHADMTCEVSGPARMTAADIVVPGDPSSAAFLVGAAALVPGSEVVLPDVALNPSRLGFVRVLHRMGADVDAEPSGTIGGERVGTITAVFARGLTATTVSAPEAPSLIDEVPLLAVVAASAHGTTRFEGVGELRVKESDRLSAIAEGLGRLGACVRTGEDWLEVDGPARLHGGVVDSLGDHRLAMAWAVASLTAAGPVTVEGFDAVEVSYPRFAADLAGLARATGA
jgi:3-phosphoshikimate 1-carboxyvinyltransferase